MKGMEQKEELKSFTHNTTSCKQANDEVRREDHKRMAEAHRGSWPS